LKQLVIDTATYSGGAGIFNNYQTLGMFYLNVTQTYSQRLLFQIYSLLESLNLSLKDLDAVTFSRGPGTFTGLRIGLSTAKTLAFCQNIPLIMPSTLAAYAWAVSTKGYVAPLLDARKKEVFAALYKNTSHSQQTLINPTVIGLNDFLSMLPRRRHIYFTGPGSIQNNTFIKKQLREYAHFVGEETFLQFIPALAYLGYTHYQQKDFTDIITGEPLYIRRSDAEIAKDSQS